MAASAIDRLFNYFGDCSVVPAEQAEYYIFTPLVQPFDEVQWDEDGQPNSSSKDAEVEAAQERLRKALQQDVLNEQLRKAGRPHLAGKQSFTSAEVVEVARVLGYAPDRADERSAPSGRGQEQLKEWLQTLLHEEDDTVSNLCDVFRRIDTTRSGVVTLSQLRNVLSTIGGDDALSDAEFKRFVAQFKLKDTIKYEPLIHQLLKKCSF